MNELKVTMGETDAAYLRAAAESVGMSPQDFLGLAGAALADAINGIGSVMARSPDVRAQVHDLIALRKTGTLNDAELSAALIEIGELDGDDRWSVKTESA